MRFVMYDFKKHYSIISMTFLGGYKVETKVKKDVDVIDEIVDKQDDSEEDSDCKGIVKDQSGSH